MIEGQEGVTWEDWCALADACEEHGVETLFRSDHYISQGDEAHNVAHDAWTTISALAARTTKLRFGTLVSPATFRAPGLLANAAATADHVSRRTDRARDGRGLDGTRAPRVRLPVPGDAREGRDARRAGRDRPPALDRGARRLPRPALHARGRARAAATRPAAEAAAARRRERRARHRRAGAPVRRRVQHAVRLSRGRGGDPGEDPAAALQRHDRLRHRRDARRRARACAHALRPEATRRLVRRMARRSGAPSRSSARSRKRPSASAPTSTPAATA